MRGISFEQNMKKSIVITTRDERGVKFHLGHELTKPHTHSTVDKKIAKFEGRKAETTK